MITPEIRVSQRTPASMLNVPAHGGIDDGPKWTAKNVVTLIVVTVLARLTIFAIVVALAWID